MLRPSNSASEIIFCKCDQGFPWRLRGGESTCQCRARGLDPCQQKIPQASEKLGLRTSYRAVLRASWATTRTAATEAWASEILPATSGKTPQWEAHALQLERSPHSFSSSSRACAATERPSTVKHTETNCVTRHVFRDGCERDHGMQSSWNTHRWGTTKQNRIASIIKQSCRLRLLLGKWVQYRM